MKKTFKHIVILLLAVILAGSITACGKSQEEKKDPEKNVETAPFEDYAEKLKLDKSTATKKLEVTVKSYVDGDTTHFYAPRGPEDSGVLKARYLAIDTPESTGKIEEWGKKASSFTREKLSSASSIILESDDDKWNVDSTGERYLVWVWYKTPGSDDYKNLNLEILQNGLCIASSTANNRYGSTCMSALSQAKAYKYNIYSNEKDPDFYYGDAIELSLIELRKNVESYNGKKVAFEGVITLNEGNSIYIEEYDPDTDMYYGISVYYGFGLSGKGLDILSVGNRSRIVGTVQFYEAGGVYQVSGLQYRQMKPDDPSNIQKISDGHSPSYVLTDAETFKNKKVEVVSEDGSTVSFDYAYLALNTSISMEDLTVKSVYTTSDPESSSFGAMTLTCYADGTEIKVRTAVLRDSDGKLITEDAYIDKNINVRGIIDFYDGEYQILVLTPKDIVIN
ncbi:MAG: thermonuclease family protein [Clostridia bacterium]|nr:thermonuclease family protein [Clostridia bacterium]